MNLQKDCETVKELKKFSKKLDKVKSFDEWELINDITEDLCYNIATCKTKCGNNYCKGLQKTL